MNFVFECLLYKCCVFSIRFIVGWRSYGGNLGSWCWNFDVEEYGEINGLRSDEGIIFEVLEVRGRYGYFLRVLGDVWC